MLEVDEGDNRRESRGGDRVDPSVVSMPNAPRPSAIVSPHASQTMKACADSTATVFPFLQTCEGSA